MLTTAWLAGKWFCPPRDLGGGRYLDGRPDQAEVIEACRRGLWVAAEHRRQSLAKSDPELDALFPLDGGDDDDPALVREAADLLDALTEGAAATGDASLPDMLRWYFPKCPGMSEGAALDSDSGRTWTARELLCAMLLLLCDRAAGAFRTGKLLDVTTYMTIVGELRAAVAMTYEAERHEHEKRERAVRLNDQRHRRNREAQQWVVADWLANRTRFRSAESAAMHYIELLQAKGFNIGNVRTVADWIRDAARANRIRLR